MNIQDLGLMIQFAVVILLAFPSMNESKWYKKLDEKVKLKYLERISNHTFPMLFLGMGLSALGNDLSDGGNAARITVITMSALVLAFVLNARAQKKAGITKKEGMSKKEDITK